uniref:WSC domain-containing protein n=1 Tax=Macrostomum lignano TaxID=282301 RepID=A0A1I8GKV5_9PLAT
MKKQKLSTSRFQGPQLLQASFLSSEMFRPAAALLVLFCAALLLTCVTCRFVRFAYLGCYKDNSSPRDLNGLSEVSKIGGFAVHFSSGSVRTSTEMSHELCSGICFLGEFRYFGMQNSRECYCGNSYGSHGLVSEGNCSAVCSGNPMQKCGGYYRNSIFFLSYPVSNSNTYKVVKQSSPPVTSGATSVWPVAAQSVEDCLLRCSARADCRAAVFSRQELACHLLEFVYPPGQLSGPEWTLFVRG